MSQGRIPEAAERLFSQIFNNLFQRQSDITTFRKLAMLGQQSAAEALSAENYQFALSILADPQYNAFFKDREAVVAFFGGPKEMSEKTTAKQLNLFNAAVDAASLVFVHSTVDAAISDLCRVTFLIDPARWHKFVEAQKVSLAILQSKHPDEIVAARLEAHLAALEKESLQKRTERLYEVCRPGREFDPISNFKYDVATLERLDRLRQEFVHGSGPRVIVDCDVELLKLLQIGMHFFAMVNNAFGVKINPLFALGLPSPDAEQPGASP